MTKREALIRQIADLFSELAKIKLWRAVHDDDGAI